MSKQREAFEAWASQWVWFSADSKDAAWEAWQASRSAALEEAVHECNALWHKWARQEYRVGIYGEAYDCAGAIRALKEQS